MATVKRVQRIVCVKSPITKSTRLLSHPQQAEEMARIEIMKAWFNYTFHEQKQQVQAVLRKAQEEGIITEPED